MKVAEMKSINKVWENKIPALESFLEAYREESEKYYRNKIQEYHDEIHNPNRTELSSALFSARTHSYIIPQYQKIIIDAGMSLHDVEKNYYSDIMRFFGGNDQYIETQIQKTLDREIDMKRADLIYRCSKKVGTIVDVKNMEVGMNGSLNGIVVGDTGKSVKVHTIGAGGYDIQRYHFRVLIKELK